MVIIDMTGQLHIIITLAGRMKNLPEQQPELLKLNIHQINFPKGHNGMVYIRMSWGNRQAAAAE